MTRPDSDALSSEAAAQLTAALRVAVNTAEALRVAHCRGQQKGNGRRG
jgi:hypothetical protein